MSAEESSRSVIALACAIVLVAGCAAKTAQAPSLPADFVPSGFLTDYSLLSAGADDQILLRYRNPEADFSKYDKIFFDRVHVWRTQAKSLDGIEEAELQRLADDLYAAIRDELEKDYELLDGPTAGAMEIHIALTEVEKSDVGLDVFTTLAPPARIVSEARQLATGTQSFVGSAMIEIEIDDATTKEILFAGIDRRIGRKALAGSFSSWSDVNDAFSYWAERIATGLERARRGKL